ncbi:MAG: NYN domain-containing protein [Candidatus Portiera sp.]|nr:NYN domain-containing protein [Portiera sp.]
MGNRERVFCYVDGYNLYRSVRGFLKTMDNPQHIWYDLIKLSREFSSENQDIARVYYCSAPYSYDRRKGKMEMPPKIRETRRAQNIFCRYHREVYGKGLFKIKFGYFRRKGSVSSPTFFQEKQTDVNLALLALDDAHNDLYDHAFIFSGDGDFAPLAKLVLKLGKKISFILPPGSNTSRIINNFDTRIINGGHIEAAQFDPGDNAPDPQGIY